MAFLNNHDSSQNSYKQKIIYSNSKLSEKSDWLLRKSQWWRPSKEVYCWILVALIQMCLCGVTDQYEILALHYQSHFKLSQSTYLLLFTVILWPNLLSVVSALVSHWFPIGLIGLLGFAVLTISHFVLAFSAAMKIVSLAFFSRFLIGLGWLNAFDIALLPLLGSVFTPRQVAIASTVIRLITSFNSLLSLSINLGILHQFKNSLATALLLTSIPLIPGLFFYWKLVGFIAKCEEELTETESAVAMVTVDDHTPFQCIKSLPSVFWLLMVTETILVTTSIFYKAAQMSLLQIELGMSESEATTYLKIGCVAGIVIGVILSLIVFQHVTSENNIEVGMFSLLVSMFLLMCGSELLQRRLFPLLGTSLMNVADIIIGSWTLPVLLTAAGPSAVYASGLLSTSIFISATLFSQIQGYVIEKYGPPAILINISDMALLCALLTLLALWMLNGKAQEEENRFKKSK